MHYVYILQSVEHPDQHYTGLTDNVTGRLKEHNSGKSKHTAKYKPWKIISSHYFENEDTALASEKYLKSGSGRAFSQKRLR
ncbi:GIY-YIG nuclease family protein [Sphingorhabdus sp. Alg231-15]|uniref:GIY-YIG nuclease family protein n=1 Tax=Sphingorhabdus sp. Alg231-15 TaxID=1922222 RepID=UPI000D561457